ncbi:MAG: cyclase family protein [Candidatus Caldarchaeum sp.]|nr:cyclase family protein [Candidatus Caldarchaeum sp.]
MSKSRANKELTMIPLDKIVVPEWLPSREDLGDIVSLAKQLRTRGDVSVPIKVRKTSGNLFELVWGRRRLEAAKLAGLSKISAYVERNLDDEQFLLQHCLENLHRLDRDPVEEAKLFSYMRSRLSKSYEELAEMLGLSRDYIYNRVELLRLSPAVIGRFRSIRSATKAAVGLYHLRLLLTVKDPHLQLRLLEETAAYGLSVRELAQRIEELLENRWAGVDKRRGTHSGGRWFHDLTFPITVNGSGNLFPQSVEPGHDVYNWEICRKITITHKDTHIDLPRFIDPSGKTITSYPPDKFVGRGAVIQLSKDSMEPISREDLENSGPSVRRGDIVLINTGWWRHREDAKYLEHPYLTEEAAEWLASRRIKMLCMDTPSPDMPVVKRLKIGDRPVHEIFLNRDILIVENLYNIQVANRRLTVYVVPFYFSELSEIPVKVIAVSGYR